LAFTFAQQYPNNGWGDDGYYQNDGYYSDEDDQNYFPDDYYYNYPQDYYPRIITKVIITITGTVLSISTGMVFLYRTDYRWQIDQILRLNNLYVSFSAWNNFTDIILTDGIMTDSMHWKEFWDQEFLLFSKIIITEDTVL
jgi:hypothetical protein